MISFDLINKTLKLFLFYLFHAQLTSANPTKKTSYSNTSSVLTNFSVNKISNDLVKFDANLSSSINEETSFIELYTFPVIIIIGTVCNFLTFLVMRRKKMRHQSTYFYMAVLAIADEMVLLVGCLNFWLYSYNGSTILLLSVVSCKLACMALYATLHFSVWIVVIMTMERFIAVALPLQANRICTVKRAKIATMILALVILCINAHFLFTHTLIHTDNNKVWCYTTNDLFEFFMLKIWTWIDAVLYSFIPLTLLIVFNILIVYNLIKASNNIEKYNDSHNLKKSEKYSNGDFKLDQRKNTAESNGLVYMLRVCCNFFRSKLNRTQSSRSSSSTSSGSYNNNTNKYKHYIFKKIPATTHGTLVTSVNDKSLNYYQQSLESKKANGNQYLTQQQQQQQSPLSSANRKLTIMLLVVSITFCLTSMPIVTLQNIEQAGLINKSKGLLILKGVFLSLQYLNHSVNFFLYAVTGKTFRREFFDMFSVLWRSGKKMPQAESKSYQSISCKVVYKSGMVGKKQGGQDSLENSLKKRRKNVSKKKPVPEIKITEVSSNNNEDEGCTKIVQEQKNDDAVVNSLDLSAVDHAGSIVNRVIKEKNEAQFEVTIV